MSIVSTKNKRKNAEPQGLEVPAKLSTADKEAIKPPDSKVPAIHPIKISLPAQPKMPEKTIKPAKKLKEVFNTDDESEEEEIPEEARIRMRNKGRFTPTSSGPNSYGKSQFGFIDRRALLNRQTEALNQIASNEDR
ncbi:PEST proteolytic signal containing nuclear [Fasciola hepatica]|uniref:PEST proteolytic signal-containing nuclear protein n=1 Tax=Fasciola hepatica TaxID=6192 RepID=A0A4E0RA63_FASHE|nr:PEST proteolytic signal containing nuclear [Fasciola hepatica]